MKVEDTDRRRCEGTIAYERDPSGAIVHLKVQCAGDADSEFEANALALLLVARKVFRTLAPVDGWYEYRPWTDSATPDGWTWVKAYP